MHSSSITWNGICSEDLGLKIEKYPAFNRPARKHTSANVPGRNGSEYVLQDAFSEIVQAYTISFKNPAESSKSVAEWLHSANGYARLEDTYDPNVYRMAIVVDSFDVDNSLNRAGRALIQFRCRPERYIKEEYAEAVTITTPRTMVNPTNHISHPLIKIEGQGYPSMLPTTQRTDVENRYDNSYTIEGLSPTKARYNFIGLTAPYTEETGSLNIDQAPEKINTFMATEGTVSITAMESGYGVGMNRSVNPLTTYTLSYLHGTSNFRTDKVAIVLTDKYGNMINNAGVYNATPFITRQSITFTTPAEAYWAVIIFISTGGMTSPCIFEDIQFNLGAQAKPYVPFSDSTASAILFGDTLIRISELYDFMYIDCETMNAYREPGENLNPLITITDELGNLTTRFPRLVPGDNLINAHPGDNDWISSVTVEPRFWTL